jgi:hypothetical protein
LNNYNQTIASNWAANTDIQFCGNPFGAAQYCAYYASKNEPFSEFVQSFMAATARLGTNATLVEIYCNLGNATVGLRKISHQEAVWILLGFKYTELSRKISVVSVVPADQRSNVLKNRDALEQTDEASTDIIASGKLLAYMNRPVELEDLSMMQFEQDYKYYKDTKQNRYFFQTIFCFFCLNITDFFLFNLCMINNTAGCVRIHKRGVVVVPNRKFTIDIENDEACYSILALHHPWRRKGEWLETYTTSIDAVADIIVMGDSPLATMLDRIQHMDAVTEDAQLQHRAGYKGDGDDETGSSSKTDAFYAYDNTVLQSPYEVNSTGFTTLHGYISEQYQSTQQFVKDQLTEWEQQQQAQTNHLEDNFLADLGAEFESNQLDCL